MKFTILLAIFIPCGVPNHDGAVLHATKLFHVSPFFPMDGEYRLMIRGGGADGPVRLLMRYLSNGSARLTATSRVTERMTTWGILKSLCKPVSGLYAR